MDSIEKLLSVGGDSLSRQPAAVNSSDFDRFGLLGAELANFLSHKNGFYAFESALHVFPAASFENELTLSRWNAFDLWRHEYGDLAENIFFFAEDVFGDQFCLHENQTCSFDAETGELKPLCSTFEEWSKQILEEYEVLTGYPLSHDWQIRHGALPSGKRLMPKIPFVLGGEYAVDNLYALASVSGMKSRGNLARQIRNLPDGTQIEFGIVE